MKNEPQSYVLDDPRADELPKTLFGYRVRELLGEGVGTRVYRVRDAEEKAFALKHILVKDEPDLRFVNELKLEHEIASAVAPGPLRKAIALKQRRAFMVGAVQEIGLVLELVKGQTLELIKWPGEAIVVDLFINVAQALRQLHTAGWLHLDIRPSNIIVTERKGAKLIDYGNCAKIGSSRPHVKSLPDYISLEQLEGKTLTRKTDMFLFGWALYWALCRRNLPVVEKPKPEGIKAGKEMFHLAREIAKPCDLSKRIPVRLSDYIMRCLEVKPDTRPDNIEEALEILEEAKGIMAG